MRSQNWHALRGVRRSSLRSRTVGGTGGGLAASLRLQLDRRRHRLLRQKVLHVGRVAATPEESHERVDERSRRSIGGRAVAAVTLRWPTADASIVFQDLPHATFEPACDRALSPLRETFAIVAAVFIFAGLTAPAAASPYRRRITAVFLPVLVIRGSSPWRCVRHASMSSRPRTFADRTRRKKYQSFNCDPCVSTKECLIRRYANRKAEDTELEREGVSSPR